MEKQQLKRILLSAIFIALFQICFAQNSNDSVLANYSTRYYKDSIIDPWTMEQYRARRYDYFDSIESRQSIVFVNRTYGYLNDNFEDSFEIDYYGHHFLNAKGKDTLFEEKYNSVNHFKTHKFYNESDILIKDSTVQINYSYYNNIRHYEYYPNDSLRKVISYYRSDTSEIRRTYFDNYYIDSTLNPNTGYCFEIKHFHFDGDIRLDSFITDYQLSWSYISYYTNDIRDSMYSYTIGPNCVNTLGKTYYSYDSLSRISVAISEYECQSNGSKNFTKTVYTYDKYIKDFFSKSQTETDETSLTVFPNPVSTDLNFNLPQYLEAHYVLNIYDLQGRLHMQSSLDNHESIIDVSNLRPGLFIYKITSDIQNYHGKFIKQ
ncbi:MAG: T9SS type A sorting domain-containing protein [Cytophagales bacterium]